MAGAIDKGHQSYNDFNDGYNSRTNPLSAIDKKILNFALLTTRNPNVKTHGQILRNFGMYPPEFWMRAQRLSQHPELKPEMQEKLSKVFPDPSRPGPMGGGAPVKTDGKNFSHGLEW
jgi:hypothetical protein